MAKIKISALPAATSLSPTDLLTAVSSSVSTKITVENLSNNLTQVSSSISASYALTASYATTSSYALTASYVATSSYAENGGVTSIIAGSSISIDTSTGDVTISYAGGGGAFPFTGSANISGSLTLDGPLNVTGSITALEGIRTDSGFFIKNSANTFNNYLGLDVNDNLTIPSYSDGEYGIKFVDGGGNLFANLLGSPSRFVLTGSAIILGDILVSGGGITGSLLGTSSWASNAITASFVTTAQTASYVQIAQSASFVQTAQTASYVLNAVSSSFSTNSATASYVVSALTASFVNALRQTVIITGSLVITGSSAVTVIGSASIVSGALAVGNIAASTTVGRIDASNDVVAFSTSDERLKTEISNISDPIVKINLINGVNFTWVENPEVHGNSGRDVGVIAQELEAVLPEVVTTRDNGYKAVKYEKIVPLLIEAIKELQKQIDELKNK